MKNGKIDTLLQKLDSIKGDVQRLKRIDLLLEISSSFESSDLETCMKYALLAEEESGRLSPDEQQIAPMHRIYDQLGTAHTNLSQYDTAIGYFKRALEIARQRGLESFLPQSHEHLGTLYWNRGDFPEALEEYDQALDLFQKINDATGVADVQNKQGKVFYHLGDYDRALDLFHTAYKKREALNDREGMGSSLNAMAAVYLKLRQYDNAEELNLRALEIFREIGNKVRQSQSLNNLGLLYMHRKKFKESLAYLEESLALKIETGSERGRAITLGNIGQVYFNMQDFDKAVHYHEQSLEIAEKSQNKPTMGTVLTVLGSIFWHTGKFKKSEETFTRALELGDRLGSKEICHASCAYLSKINEQNRRYRKALHFERRASEYNQENLNEKRQAIIQEITTRFEVERKEKEAEIYRLRNIEISQANRKLRETNALIREQNEKIKAQSEALEETMTLLRENEAQLQAIFDNAVVGIVTTDPEGSYRMVNHHFCHMLGYDENEILGKSSLDFTHPNDAAIDQSYLKKLSRGEANEYHMQKRYRRKDGSYFWAYLSCSALRDSPHRKIARIAIVVDIDERMEAVRKLNQSYKDLKRAQTSIIQLEKRNTALAMAVTANHELNQPLMTLRGNIDYLKISLEDVIRARKLEKHLEKIDLAFDRIQELLTKLKSPQDGVQFVEYTEDTQMVELNDPES